MKDETLLIAGAIGVGVYLLQDSFKGINKAVEGLGTGISGIGSGVSTAFEGTGSGISTATQGLGQGIADLGAVTSPLSLLKTYMDQQSSNMVAYDTLYRKALEGAMPQIQQRVTAEEGTKALKADNSYLKQESVTTRTATYTAAQGSANVALIPERTERYTQYGTSIGEWLSKMFLPTTSDIQARRSNLSSFLRGVGGSIKSVFMGSPTTLPPARSPAPSSGATVYGSTNTKVGSTKFESLANDILHGPQSVMGSSGSSGSVTKSSSIRTPLGSATTRATGAATAAISAKASTTTLSYGSSGRVIGVTTLSKNASVRR